MAKTKICTQCEKEKDINDYAPKYNGTGDRRANCKQCAIDYLRSPLGLAKQLIRIQTQRAKMFNYPAPTYCGEDLLKWMKTQRNFSNMMLQWKTSGYSFKLKPSLQRCDINLGFQLWNLDLCYTEDNKERNNKETLK